LHIIRYIHTTVIIKGGSSAQNSQFNSPLQDSITRLQGSEKPIFLKKNNTQWVFGFYWVLGFIGFFFYFLSARTVGKLVG